MSIARLARAVPFVGTTSFGISLMNRQARDDGPAVSDGHEPCVSRAGFRSTPDFRFDFAHIQFASVTASLTVEQRLSEPLYFVLALLK
jgi:hypothetical protein